MKWTPLLILPVMWLLPSPVHSQADTSILLQHLTQLTSASPPRAAAYPESLDRQAAYIRQALEQFCDTTFEPSYTVRNSTYQNILGEIGPKDAPLLIIGAHYDVCGNQPGADDNASGVAGMLELARLLSLEDLPYRIQFVAWTLEEPPHFRSRDMGSYVHARSLHDDQREVYGVICLEMIGFFSDEEGSQRFPVGLMKWFYGDVGNFILLVRKPNKGRFVREFSRKMTDSQSIPVRQLTGPRIIPGVDFSDHLNFWKFGYSALMITDTAFYRNPNYHRRSDTIATLDLRRMAQVVDEVKRSVLEM